jgi:sarcosine oxidase, subunit gamma
VTADSAMLDIVEIPAQSMLNLRIAPSDAAVWTDVLGVALPLEPNTLARAGDGWIAWLGPDEWLLVSPNDLRPVEESLRAASQAPMSVVDVSSTRTTVQVSGSGARQLLAHGCALDLHPRVFGPGRCGQTRLALANVLIAAPVDLQTDFDLAPTYRVLGRASFARYLSDWLLDAAAGY